jgi:hypothetical protein
MALILFLAANPVGASSRRLEEEIRTIELRLRLSEMREVFDMRPKVALRISDLQRSLLQYKPDIVHFAGLGTTSGEIIIEDDFGGSLPISAKALGNLFSILKDNVRCVVMTAGHAATQAEAIVPHAGCVVAMKDDLSDEAAVSFSAGFYQALGFARSIRTAFDLACNQLELQGFTSGASPVLLTSPPEAADVVLSDSSRGSLIATSILMRLAEGGSNKRSETARQLGYLKDPEAVPILERRWDLEPDPTVRYWLARALGWIGGSQTVQALQRLRQIEKDAFACSGIDQALRPPTKQNAIAETNSPSVINVDGPYQAAHNE